MLAAVPSLVACGAGSSDGKSDAEASGATTAQRGPAGAGATKARLVEVIGSNSKLKVHIPTGPPSKRLVVKDLRRGSGPGIAKSGDEVVVNYVGIEYRNGRKIYDTWEEAGPSRFHLKAMRTGWELGLNGMKVGGRRELIVPSRLAYHAGALVYVVDLLEVRPWA
jgi:peptidylprolyl isomerase